MPSFCRHNRFLSSCPICSREQAVAEAPRSPGVRSSGGPVTRRRTSAPRSSGASSLRVRRFARAQDDGYRSALVPGIRSTADAERLAEELAFAQARLAQLAAEPAGLYAEVAAEADPEEATWLAFQIAYVGPLDGEEPFAAIDAVRTTWASGELPQLDGVELGPRSSHVPAQGTAALEAYRAWVQRNGSQQAAFAGESAWNAERRFARVFERLATRGLQRDTRFDLLTTLGRLGVYELSPGVLQLGVRGTADETTVAAKRVFGIGDTLLLERRAADLAEAGGVPLAALDVGLWNWSRPRRAQLGAVGTEPDADAYAGVAAALGL